MNLADAVAKIESVFTGWFQHVDPQALMREAFAEFSKAVQVEFDAHKDEIAALRAQVADLVAKVGADAQGAAVAEIGKVTGEAAAAIAPAPSIPSVGSAVGIPQAAPLEPKAP